MEAPAARLLLLLLLGAWAPAPGSASPEAPLLVNEDVKRTVDLSSHLAKVTAEVVLVHPGGGSSSRAASFLLALEPELEARLAHLGVQVSASGPQVPRPSRPRRKRGAVGVCARSFRRLGHVSVRLLESGRRPRGQPPRPRSPSPHRGPLLGRRADPAAGLGPCEPPSPGKPGEGPPLEGPDGARECSKLVVSHDLTREPNWRTKT